MAERPAVDMNAVPIHDLVVPESRYVIIDFDDSNLLVIGINCICVQSQLSQKWLDYGSCP